MNDEKALPPVLTMDAPERTLDVVTLEIQTLQRQAIEVNLMYAIEIGRRLTEAKAMLPHGQGGDYLKTQVSYSQSTANNLMRIFREYGDNQQSLFGAAKSQTFANLPYSKALRLLAIPDEEEREQFAADHDLDAMSVRELEKAIKARDEAEEKAIAAEDEARALRRETERLREEFADQSRVYKAKLTAADVETSEANRKAQEAQEALERQRKMAGRLQEALSGANANAQSAAAEQERLQRELEELRNRPVDVAVETDQEAVENARKAAIAEMTGKLETAKSARKEADKKRKAAEDALAAARKELETLKAKTLEARDLTPEEKEALTAAEVERARAEDAERLREMEKLLAQADPDTAEFKFHFAAWQEDYMKMQGPLSRIAQTDAEKATRLHTAVKTVLAHQMGEH